MKNGLFLLPFRSTLEKSRKQELLIFQEKIGCTFKNLTLLDLAFHHRSFSNEHGEVPANNERLEFIGDSILGMITAVALYKLYPEKPEGDLAKIKAAVVCEDSLSAIARKLTIDKYLVLGHGEELSGGREKKALLADAFEALVGALYLDSGFKATNDFVSRMIQPHIFLVAENKHQYRDYKSLLQEYAQKQYKIIPKYVLMSTSGPDHQRTFSIKVMIKGQQYGPASGKSKKEAEQAAAELAWHTLHPDSMND